MTSTSIDLDMKTSIESELDFQQIIRTVINLSPKLTIKFFAVRNCLLFRI
jgi:hypothetical protein